MKNSTPIQIALSKTKMQFLLLGSIVFVIIGIWFVLNPPQGSSNWFKNETVMRILGALAIVFFGGLAISISRKYNDKKPGLQIDQAGITDNSSAVSAGLIPWDDITAVEIAQVMNQQFLLIIVQNPEDYINQITNPIKKGAVKMNYQSYGTPITITSTALEIDFSELEKVILEQMQNYKAQ